MIKAKNIFKSFGDTDVLKGIDFIFEQGKTNLIIGQSGAGKTVMLKILVGLLEPSAGEIWYDHTNFSGLNKKEMRAMRMQMGMLFQGSALFDSMSVEDNVRFPMDMFTNKTEKEKQERIDYCLELVELENANKKFPSEISGGMKKRVGIARSIVLNPKYLFCDEPNSGLDPKTALVIDELIKDITREINITTVINTHDMNSVMEIGENILLLNQGKMAWTGSKDSVINADNKYLQEFIFASPFLKRLKEKALAFDNQQL
jgi:phospholipid/cholesterol/gamma-HCH transport system ATP-binding protein